MAYCVIFGIFKSRFWSLIVLNHYIVRGKRMSICVLICVTYGQLYSAWYVHDNMREHMRDVRTLYLMTGTEVTVTLWGAEVVC